MTMKTLLRRRDVRLLLAGQTLSMVGDWMMFIVLGIWAKVLTGSNTAAGFVFFALTAASLLSPLGGLVVDRVRKKPLMVGTHLALAGVMSLLLLVHDASDIWIIYLVTVLYGLGGDFFAAARSSMLKAMLPDELLSEANGALQSVREGLRIVAPLAGAAIFAAAGGAAVALVDAGTFVASACFLIALRFVEPATAPKEQHFLREVTAGIAHIRRDPTLRRLSIGVCGALLVIGFSETLIFALTAALGRPPSFIAVLGTAQGVGSILGGVSSPAVMRRLGDVRLAGLGILLFAAGDSLFLVPSLVVIFPAMMIAGLGIVWAIVAIATAYQRRSPQVLQGRVSAAANLLFSVPQTISIAVGAALIALIDYRIEIVAMAIGTTICAAYLLLTRRQEEVQPWPGDAAAQEPGLRVVANGPGALDDRLDLDADRVPAARARDDALAG
jgi:Na+/melibiose symporter-like transporter